LTKEDKKMAGPLDGIKVVEITMFQQGPVAGTKLGDLGADVIKVEAPTGDPARGFMRIIGTQVGLKGRNYYFEQHNRNKRSIVLDLRKEKGMEIFLKLIDTADVFLNNMSIEAPQKMGIGPEALLARNPRLIYSEVLHQPKSCLDLVMNLVGWSVPGRYVLPSMAEKRRGRDKWWILP
jgi:crotonobetainyl-CoA:carnitine CoA-transferase CaiB-like acyl-CoA transferase